MVLLMYCLNGGLEWLEHGSCQCPTNPVHARPNALPLSAAPGLQQDFASFSHTFEKAPKPSVVGMSEGFT